MTVVRKKNRPPLVQGDSYVEELESSLPKDEYGKILDTNKDLYPELEKKIDDAFKKSQYKLAEEYMDRINNLRYRRKNDDYNQFASKDTPDWKRNLLLEKFVTEDHRNRDSIPNSLDVRDELEHQFDVYTENTNDPSFNDIKILGNIKNDSTKNSSMSLENYKRDALNRLAKSIYPGIQDINYDNDVLPMTKGSYDPLKNTLSLRDNSPPSVTLHELIHAASESKNVRDRNPELTLKHSTGHNLIKQQKASPDFNTYNFKTGEFSQDILTNPNKLLEGYESPHFGGNNLFKDKVYDTFDSGTLDRSKIDRFKKVKKLLKGE